MECDTFINEIILSNFRVLRVLRKIMDEPTTSISEAFAASIRRAVYALPAAHHLELRQDEPVNDEDKGYARLQD